MFASRLSLESWMAEVACCMTKKKFDFYLKKSVAQNEAFSKMVMYLCVLEGVLWGEIIEQLLGKCAIKSFYFDA
jgi:hypothetical protein